MGAELAAANQFLRGHARVSGGERDGSPKALSEELRVRDGYELALAAALGGVWTQRSCRTSRARGVAARPRAGPGRRHGAAGGLPRPTGVRPFHERGRTRSAEGRVLRPLELVERAGGGPGAGAAAGERVGGGAPGGASAGLRGIAATRTGRAWFASHGEVRQLSEGGTERVLARRNERDRLIAAAEQVAQAEHAAGAVSERAVEAVRESKTRAAERTGRCAIAERRSGGGGRGGAPQRVADRAAPGGARRPAGCSGKAEPAGGAGGGAQGGGRATRASGPSGAARDRAAARPARGGHGAAAPRAQRPAAAPAERVRSQARASTARAGAGGPTGWRARR